MIYGQFKTNCYMLLAGQMCHFFEFSIFGLDRHQHDSLIQILQLFGSIIDFKFSVILKISGFELFREFKSFFVDRYHLFFDDSSKRAESLIRNEVN